MPAAKSEKGAGRRAGVPNTNTQELQQKVEASGLTPLEYMPSVMRDEVLDRDTRLDASKSAALYVHARLAAFEHSGAQPIRRHA
ncbi:MULTISPECIES: hypothetical protein [Bradyrhizobium]|jgi:hypothetical protein|uniref:hypothetical protein n=1 Tax=Bradyrhizobium TaxID=374 RepID=UPI0004824D98|nr:MULTISPECIES: hypothetical protein [Bradyrhizobium]MCA1402866.1 hypothetical protein [Bradyrhizobium sp. BRP56]MCS3448508.1 hypothetical protein [Bradyrhizobium elkanii]MCS3560351.1 hypothetical protein [Bradyrhizobium elkanii]MCW2149805.1 hypothetical protein [Bradyrhizobium elkanii]MCW2360228.1 hypothetical protein [Bradyrhizobium elkanii]